jgi:hypothetical protein
LVKELPSIFDYTKWKFSPAEILSEEQQRVDDVLNTGSIEDILLIVPGKQLLPVAARTAGMALDAYKQLVIKGLTEPDNSQTGLGQKLESAFKDQLPARYVAAATAG